MSERRSPVNWLVHDNAVVDDGFVVSGLKEALPSIIHPSICQVLKVTYNCVSFGRGPIPVLD